jgi:AraC family transcriptional regulator
MFSYIADKPLSEYIRNRRLTMAAFDLLNNSERIIDISLKYGYESQDAFTRAFKNFHGVLPSRVRNETVQLKSCPKLSFQIKIKGESHMNYQIEQWPAFKVMGISQKVKTEKAFEIIPNIWENAWKDGTMKKFLENFPAYRPSEFLGIAQGGGWGESEYMEYIIAVTNHVDTTDCE